MVGVTRTTVEAHRPANMMNLQVEKRIGLDGKERPAHRNSAHQSFSLAPQALDTPSEMEPTQEPETRNTLPEPEEEVETPKTKRGRKHDYTPCVAMQFARLAIWQLEQIKPNDRWHRPRRADGR